MSTPNKDIRLVVPPKVYKSTIVFELVFENVSELNVGGSSLDKLTSMTDNPVIKMNVPVIRGDREVLEPVPYIPGSTIKGWLRSITENIIRASSSNRAISLKDILEDLANKNPDADDRVSREIYEKTVLSVIKQYLSEEIIEKYNIGKLGLRKLLEKINNKLVNSEERTVYNIVDNVLSNVKVYPDVCNPVIEGLSCELPLPQYKYHILKTLVEKTKESIEYPCKVCRIYGLPGYRSPLTVYDAWPTDINRVVILPRTHIAIDRLRGTVAQGKTFQIEYIAPGAEFKTYILYHSTTETKTISENECKNISINDNEKIIECLFGNNKDPDNYDRENIKNILKTLAHITTIHQQLGKRKTIGMGEIKIKQIKIGVLYKEKNRRKQNTNTTPNNKKQVGTNETASTSSGNQANQTPAIPKPLKELEEIFQNFMGICIYEAK